MDQLLRAAKPADSTLLVIDVTGCPGAGSSTLAAALAARFGVVARVPGREPDGDPPDLLIRTIGAQVREADRTAIGSVDIPVVVVAGKADTRPDAARLADVAGRELGRPVVTVSGLLAAAHLDEDDLGVLRAWSAAGVAVPTSAAEFAALGDEGRPTSAAEQQIRARFIAGIGRAGLVAALRVVGETPDLSAAAVTAALRSMSGVDALVAPIAASAEQIARGRRARRLSGLRLHAARGFDREAVESRLILESVR
ncbi:hypothetical protein [Gordonia neofelifaecis]|uniref:Uncharacterized protein n=1 Tax=Gordonia neofelifaecis NRRL B-59395 TaxID=644548 RepID=F1YKD7_9ACTN|nr:hypothetical protein [Gordonia neofelifaecis]EGD54823.1 hypothetical protein SCNU_11470 [Gordonia neofelifaecis NRRL B-59395]